MASNIDLFFNTSRNKRTFPEVLAEIQEYLASKYSTLITDNPEEQHQQITAYIAKYLNDYSLGVEGMSHEELIDKLYQLAGSSWSQNVTSGNVYARLQDVLGIEYEGGQYVKYSGENLEYRLYDLHLDVENAPLAPSVPDGITQLNVTGTITVDVPLSFGFGHLPPMQITMKLNAKYVPRF